MPNAILSRRTLLGVAVTAVALNASLALAQSDKPLRLVVPLTTGSTVDTVARALSNPMGKAFGHPVVVENLPGAGGMPGTLQVVKAPKDGLTLGLISSNHAINPAIYKKVLFDHQNDITPITVFGTVPLVLVVHPSVAAKNAKDLIALMKSKPGQINVGSAGNGSTLHLAGELFGTEAGVEVRHIPYKGTGPLTTDLIGNQVQMAFISVTAAAPHVKAGKLRAIGVSTKVRSTALPDVPTLAESGLPNYSFDAWLALIGPPGLPANVTQDTYAKMRKVLGEKEVQDAMAAQGIAPMNLDPAQSVGFFKADLEKHAKLVKQSGATLD